MKDSLRGVVVVLLAALLAALALTPVLLSLMATAQAAPPTPNPRAEFEAGAVLVKFKPLVLSFMAETALSLQGFRTVSTIEGIGVRKVAVPPGKELEAIATLASSPLVEYAEPDYYRYHQTAPNDTYYGTYQGYLPYINLEQAWGISTGSDAVKIAIVDTGVYAEHADLTGKVLPGKNVANEGLSTNDYTGHGTFIAGIIAASTNNGLGISGVSWGSKVVPVKAEEILSGAIPLSAEVAGITWAADNGARVINISLGAETTSQSERDAVDYAHSKGALVVVAAGNCGDPVNYAPCTSPNPIIYPAAYEKVLAVGSFGPLGTVSSFSSHRSYVDVSAPGESIASTRAPLDASPNYLPGTFSYGWKDGTSFAAPIVAGVAALVWSVNPSLTNLQVANIITSTTADAGAPGKDDYYGWGRIDAYAALSKAQDSLATPTPTPSPTPIPTPTPTATPGPSPTPTPTPTPHRLYVPLLMRNSSGW